MSSTSGPPSCRTRCAADPLFRDTTSDAQLRGLQASLKIDRDRANTLGVSIDALRNTLYSAFGERQVSTIYTSADSYQVIMELAPEARQDERAFSNIYVRSSTGALVPLSAFATVERTVGPTAINHVGQLQAVTVSFNLAHGAALGEATANIDKYGNEIGLPPSIITRYGGDAAVFQSSQGGQAVLIIAALAGHLRAAGRAVRELHPPHHHPGRAALGGGGRAAHLAPVRP